MGIVSHLVSTWRPPSGPEYPQNHGVASPMPYTLWQQVCEEVARPVARQMREELEAREGLLGAYGGRPESIWNEEASGSGMQHESSGMNRRASLAKVILGGIIDQRVMKGSCG